MRNDSLQKAPGFGKINRSGQKNEKINLPIPNLEEWFDENQE